MEAVSVYIYPAFVKYPTGQLLTKVLQEYESIGLPGCVGSMDCTHVKWYQCPDGLRHDCIGKEGFPTLAFQVVVNHSRSIHGGFTKKWIKGCFENIVYHSMGETSTILAKTIFN